MVLSLSLRKTWPLKSSHSGKICQHIFFSRGAAPSLWVHCNAADVSFQQDKPTYKGTYTWVSLPKGGGGDWCERWHSWIPLAQLGTHHLWHWVFWLPLPGIDAGWLRQTMSDLPSTLDVYIRHPNNLHPTCTIKHVCTLVCLTPRWVKPWHRHVIP